MWFYNKISFKSSITYLLFLLISIHTYSQVDADQNKSDFWKRVSFGGGFGLNFGDGFFSGTLAPSAIYNFNKHFAAGLGVSGTYTEQKNDYRSTIIGVSILSLFNPIPSIQASAEFEEYSVSRTFETVSGDFKDRYWVPALFVGLGYRNGNFTFGLRYDLLFDDEKSIYADPYTPFVRFYF